MVHGNVPSVHPLHNTHWIHRMFQDPWFVRHAKARWALMRPRVTRMVNQIPAAAAALDGSVKADWRIWHTKGIQNSLGVHAKTYNGEVRFLQSWLRARKNWMSAPSTRW
jgi:hypothetical protein